MNNIKRRVGEGRSHSKIILIGEHSVVYGYPAIALPLKDVEVSCQIEKSDTPLLYISEDPLSTAVFSALEYLEISDYHLSLSVTSRIPEKRGMGSSAAVSIAAIRAVFDYFNYSLDKETLEMLVNQAEIIAHTNPSGLDAKTCLSNQAVKFIRNKGFELLDFQLDAYLVIADTGIHGHTKEAVQNVKNMNEHAFPILHQLGKLTEQFEKAFVDKSLHDMGKILSKAHIELQKLGVSIEKSDNLVKTALENGALGAKMSGGGLGGCVIALSPDMVSAQSLADKLMEKGAINTWIERI